MNSIELFSGTGGLALGLQFAGFHHEALFERDKAACSNLRTNSRLCSLGWNVIESDVREVDFRKYTDKIDVLAGGPPCQPFSFGGKGLAFQDSRDMFPEAIRTVREIRPKAFIFENVRGLLRKSFSTYFNYILLQLTHPDIERKPGQDRESHLKELEQCHTSRFEKGLTYHVTFRLIDAADYGVPQRRHRVVIVGFRSDIDASWHFPDPTHSQDRLLYDKWISGAYWEEHSMKKPERCPLSDRQLEKVRNNCEVLLPLRRWKTVRDAIKDIPEKGDIWTRSLAKEYPGHIGSKLDEPSKTIKAGAHGVPGGENMLILDDGALRYYSVRESARIQTFPDNFVFGSSWSESMRQIGNAVPVKLGEIIGKSILTQMAV